MTVTRLVRPEPRLIVDLELSVWSRVADNARYQADKCQDWTIVNLLDDVFRAVEKALKETT